ncbi:hypothetical protein ANO11243_068300 [Dothideomycetidae sp. 11243]|nr:hypothetical protein ANO11243_068300 [fungal sp. No.11243]
MAGPSLLEDQAAPPPPPPSAVARKVPPKLEDLMASRKAAAAEAAKPKFIRRADRERMALEQQQREAAAAAQNHSTGPRAKFSNGVTTTARLPNGGSHKRTPSEERRWTQHRLRYMGPETATSNFSASKKRKRTTDKKFNFDWDPEDDTTKDADELWKTRQEANFFGRGRQGGFPDGDLTKAVEYAKAIEKYDPETGKERAKQFLDAEKARIERNSRMGIGKHWSEKKLEDMRERDWRIFKEDFQISSRGGSIPNPMRSWTESGLPRRLLDIVDQAGYKDPSPVQRAAIPIALQSRDLIGVAVTGSGKTAAFLLPLLVYISELPPLDESTKMDGPYAIILAPTRELAQQIELEAKKFATPLGFTCVSLVGGHSIEEQAYNMRDGAEIIIATPGRLVDCIERRVLVLSQCCYIIMDEADRMIDMGFEEPVNRILSALPVSNEKPDTDAAEDSAAMSRHLGDKDRYRQTMMYTATMPAAVERIARNYLRRPAIVTIGNEGEAVDTVEQRVEFLQGEDKRKKRMAEILTSRQFAPPVIVFVNIKRNCDAVARDIQRMGFSAVTLHGSKTQEQREAALQGLKDHRYEVLVATDLAGRGIDVQDVSLVINFNMAPSIEAYTHRIGRTGRAGKSGTAITFLGHEDSDVLYDLRKMIQSSSVSKLPEELRKHEAAQQPRQKGGGAAKKYEDSGTYGGKGGWN